MFIKKRQAAFPAESTQPIRKTRNTFWLCFLMVLALCGCGIKGPLYLPKESQAESTPATSTPAPASQETEK